MRYLLLAGLVVALVSCQSWQSEKTTMNNTAAGEKTSIETFKSIVPNDGTGYSWQKHFTSSKQDAQEEYIYNQADNMIELLNHNPNYHAAIEAAQSITNDKDKWLIYQNWAESEANKIGFAYSKDGHWTAGVISEYGEVRKYENSAFTMADFEGIEKFDRLKCTPNVIHANTISVSIGSMGNQRDYDFYDEAFFEKGKCESEKNTRNYLNGVVKTFTGTDIR